MKGHSYMKPHLGMTSPCGGSHRMLAHVYSIYHISSYYMYHICIIYHQISIWYNSPKLHVSRRHILSWMDTTNCSNSQCQPPHFIAMEKTRKNRVFRKHHADVSFLLGPCGPKTAEMVSPETMVCFDHSVVRIRPNHQITGKLNVDIDLDLCIKHTCQYVPNS